ncbi:CPBP family intramembrane glutamic endopeptidase [Paenibacillus rhizophilus]
MRVLNFMTSFHLTCSTNTRPAVREGITALLYFVYVNVIYYLLGLFYKSQWMDQLTTAFPDKDWMRLAFTVPAVVLQLVPLFIILKLRGETWGSIGIKRSKIVLSIIIGLIAVLPFRWIPIANWMFHGKSLPLDGGAVLGFLYYLALIALPEELIFRGYIQTRIMGLIPSKFVAILTTGVLFAITHVPFQMAVLNLNYAGYIAQTYMHLIIILGLHLYFTYIYTRTNNIAGSALCHALIDFIIG